MQNANAATNRGVELSQLLRELQEASTAVRRNTNSLKNHIFGAEPASGEEVPKSDHAPSVIGVLTRALRDLSETNDRLTLMRDSCNMGLLDSGRGQPQPANYA